MPDVQIVRLSVNLATDVADVLKLWKSRKRITLTESVRRAIAVWDFVETERAKGNTFAIIESDGRLREVVVAD